MTSGKRGASILLLVRPSLFEIRFAVSNQPAKRISKREGCSWGRVTQGGARSSLALGYYRAAPCRGFGELLNHVLLTCVSEGGSLFVDGARESRGFWHSSSFIAP